MTAQRVKRRLAAILAADMVGYSRLMEKDEEGTIARQKVHRSELIDPKIAEHDGRIVKSTGDGLLVEFSSAVDAVTCATKIQRGMAEREASVPQARRITYRIGINVGDIVIDGDDIVGDGVNIAARLEALCAPGGVALSDDAFRHVDGKTELGFTDAGEHQVKNISRAVRMWRWTDTEAPGGFATPVASERLPLPEKPSIAVLPFDNMSGDPNQDFFSDGIAEDIITALSRFHFLFVIARNTSFTYKGKAVDVKQVSNELGVQYVLEGSVRRAGNRIRVTSQLIDAVADRHVWAERFDRDLDDMFAIQDEITEHIAMATAPELQAAETKRIRHKPVPELGVWEMIVRAAWHTASFSLDDSIKAKDLLSKALERDPDNSGALAALAHSYAIDSLFGWHRPPPESVAKASESAQRAVDLDKRDDSAQSILGVVLFLSKRQKEAVDRLETAIQLNPNHSFAWGALGIALVYLHEEEKAAEALRRAIRLSPRDPMLFYYIAHLGIMEYLAGRYEQALEWFEKANRENPNVPTGYRILAAAHAMLGNLQEARAAYEELDRRAPGITIAISVQGAPFADPADAEHFAEGWRRAGMPES